MKIHLAWIRRTATAAIVAGAGVMPAAAQYAPYRPLPQQPAPAQPAAQPAVPAQQRAVPVQQQAVLAPQPAVPAQPTAPIRVAQAPVYQQTPAPAAQTPYSAWQMTQASAPYQPYQPAVAQYQPAADRYQTTATQYPQTAAPYVASTPYAPTASPVVASYPTGYPTYPAVARQPNGSTADGNVGMPAPEPPANGEANGASNGAPASVDNGYNGHTNGHAANGYSMTSGGDCGQDCSTDSGWGVSDYFGGSGCETQWFGGLYFLFMERDNPTPQKLTVQIDHPAATDPYFPNADITVLGTHFVDYDFRAGVEGRFGSTFTISEPCDSGCYGGCNSCAPCDMYAWEVAWWGLDDDVETYTYVDTLLPVDDVRIYGMKNFAGLEYDRDADGTAEGTVNTYYGYQLPIPDPGPGPYPDGYVSVLAQHVRTNFKAQNLELNIFRFPVCQAACGGCNSGCSGSSGGCGDNGSACGCEQQCCPSSFSAYGSCGVRYFRVDDDFMYANEFSEWAGGAPDQGAFDGFYDGDTNDLYYDIQVENHLVGPQVGWTMNYNYACKWNFFCNSTFGFFNNHIESVQQMWGGGGGVVRFQQSGEDFYVRSTKNDLSFLGELRLGGSYDISCNWRAVMAYRAVAIAGLATSVDQIPEEFSNAEWVAIIDSDNSMIIHGVQVGAECRY